MDAKLEKFVKKRIKDWACGRVLVDSRLASIVLITLVHALNKAGVKYTDVNTDDASYATCALADGREIIVLSCVDGQFAVNVRERDTAGLIVRYERTLECTQDSDIEGDMFRLIEWLLGIVQQPRLV